MNDHPFIPLEWNEKAPASMLKLAEKHYRLMKQRRTTRHFSSKEVDRRLIELAILSGSTAPNGAHLQPWTWVAVKNSDLKSRLRKAAEEEERKTYSERMPAAWSEVLSQTQAGLIEGLQRPEPAPIESIFGGESLTTETSLREMGNQFADALSAWPEICEASKSFKPD